MLSKLFSKKEGDIYVNKHAEGLGADGEVRDVDQKLGEMSAEELTDILKSLSQAAHELRGSIKIADSKLATEKGRESDLGERLKGALKEVDTIKSVVWEQAGDIAALKRTNMSLKQEVRELKIELQKKEMITPFSLEDPEQPGQSQSAQPAKR